MKSNVKENIGYIAIAIVVALTLVLSVVAIDTYQNKDIVANASVGFDGQLYEDIPFDSYEEIPVLFSVQDGVDNLTFNLDNFVFDAQTLYCIRFTCIISEVEYSYAGYFYPTNSYDSVYVNNESESCIGGFALVPLSGNSSYSYQSYACYVYHEMRFSDLFIVLLDIEKDFSYDYDYSFDFYKVPQQVDGDNSTTDTFLSLIGDGITFGFESIATGVSYTMDNLFIVDGELTNFSIVIFLTLGIGLALAIVKYVLRFIFSLGGNRKW